MMNSANNLTKIMFVVTALLLILVFFYKPQSDQKIQSKPEKLIDLSYINLHGEDNSEKITELNTLLSIISTSIIDLNEEIIQNKLTNEERLEKIELSLKELSLEEEISKETVFNEPVILALEKPWQLQEQALDQVRTFDDALAQEDRDESWATGMEETMLIASQDEVFQGSNFNSPLCKSTFCKIEVSHLDIDSRDDFESIRHKIPNSYHIQHFEEAGELRSILYIIKKGEEPNSVIFNTLNETS